MTDNKNQPAFPASRKYLTPDNDIFESFTEGGLTKREYAAIQAMKGILSNSYAMQIISESVKPEDHFTFLSDAAVKHADALIVELDKPHSTAEKP